METLKSISHHNMGSGPVFVGIALILGTYMAFRRRSTIRNIPGPPSPSWIFGNMRQLLLSREYGDYEFQWQRLYGPVYRVKGCFGQDRLIVADPLALQHVLNSPFFEHGPTLDNAVSLLFDESCLMAAKGIYVVFAEFSVLMRTMHVGFTASVVQDYRPVFERVAQAMTEQFEKFSASPTDVCPTLSEATLNAISQAALGYSTQELGKEFVSNNAQVMALASSQSAAQIFADAVVVRLPKWIWRAATRLPAATLNTIRTAKYFTKELGEKVVAEKIDAARRGSTMEIDVFDMLCDSEKKATLTSSEVIAQTGIILVAGQETTTNTLALGLVELARHPKFQDELRAEIHSSLGTVDYDNMPLLNAFIKETLRLYPSGAFQEKMATQDTVIPLARAIRTRTGDHHITGAMRFPYFLCMLIIHDCRLEALWGEDACDFRPSRWLDGTTYQGHALGPYANLLSFFGGPRVCLGWRFAILEMQVFFSELVGKFSFAVPEGGSIHTRLANTLMPAMPNGKKGAPLCITRI
ncbi:Cytochrome P450 [Mycena venus]|uniref:Cytochrome P450 n=1 Tax=Mycena venus TaxID=2733690 RepID=A0A8H6XKW6_9AGAR|nr:Cytochrome P450 [Mycena venus]